MQHRYNIRKILLLAVAPVALAAGGCDKLLDIDQPISSITTAKVFDSNEKAISAMAGIYTKMVNGEQVEEPAFSSIGGGVVSILAAMSADDYRFAQTNNRPVQDFAANRLSREMSSSVTYKMWEAAYKNIYDANAVLEGIAASTSAKLTSDVRVRLTGEAKFIRAFVYFQMVNLFGDVPLVLTTNFNETRLMPKTPAVQVWAQIRTDLQQAVELLDEDYGTQSGERIKPNKSTAKAMLARVYLYDQNWPGAATLAKEVIENANYALAGQPGDVFLKNSPEAIWQLKQDAAHRYIGNASAEGSQLLPTPLATGGLYWYLTDELLAAFEPGDLRKAQWSGPNTFTGTVKYYPYKYKTGKHSAVAGGELTEYNMMVRLAEVYLIRAEAVLKGSRDKTEALRLVNLLRARAGLTEPLPATLTDAEVEAAVMHERRVELFGEWGHRWMDLRRTGAARAVLSACSWKQPWAGDYQFLYPIPHNEMLNNPNLQQNPGY
ncbi:RagB/SusD family nutrient uptake outer membrane protein [Chitinophaga sp. NPDC101104]|uniref:RagB/SusD family nutrient uptake outer membrane protein n=1 Tax=Chitinophaga sp. NPDC101104 TaxID=3390561 RepID=UPI003CFC7FC7